MFKIENEIFSQYEALNKSYDYLLDKKNEIMSFIKKNHFKSITFIGCGSSYCLCKSAEISYKLRTGQPANSIAAGDLLMNFTSYNKLLEETLLVVPSRSGSTSEVVMAVKKAEEELGVRCISICAKENTPLGSIAGLSLEIPWAFDESVCQTRTVSNLYLANLLLIGFIADDTALVKELREAIKFGEQHIKYISELARNIIDLESFEKVCVLADSEIAGIAEEGALAFNEICQLSASYYHILDVRHGPMVLVNNNTLVLIACPSDENSYVKNLICDIKNKGAVVVIMSSSEVEFPDSDYNVIIPQYKNSGVIGMLFIILPQLLSFYKALKNRVNPDAPDGLEPWIKL